MQICQSSETQEAKTQLVTVLWGRPCAIFQFCAGESKCETATSALQQSALISCQTLKEPGNMIYVDGMVATGNRLWKNKCFQDPNITSIHHSQLHYYIKIAKLQAFLRKKISVRSPHAGERSISGTTLSTTAQNSGWSKKPAVPFTVASLIFWSPDRQSEPGKRSCGSFQILFILKHCREQQQQQPSSLKLLQAATRSRVATPAHYTGAVYHTLRYKWAMASPQVETCAKRSSCVPPPR